MEKSEADRLDAELARLNLPKPGFKWRHRANGARVPYWFADDDSARAGYPLKSANLTPFSSSAKLISDHCLRLQGELRAWKFGVTDGPAPDFDGTFKTLIEIWRSDPESPYNANATQKTRKLYDVYATQLIDHIGALRIEDSDGRDVKRWFNVWAHREDPNNPRSPYLKLAAGRVSLAILKGAISFGVTCRRPGCKDFKDILSELQFPIPRPRQHAPSRDQMIAASDAARAANALSRAFVYALQFETTIRQQDIIGQWVPLSDPRPSDVIQRGEKWVGLTWNQIDENLILNLTHGKTAATSGQRGIYDLKVCPMVMAVLADIPPEQRKGPLIVNERTSFPYRYESFRSGWKADYKAAGLPEGIWNRDTRAGGNTEGQNKGALLEDRKKVIGHTAASRTTDQVYDRGAVEAHRRVMQKRTGNAE